MLSIQAFIRWGKNMGRGNLYGKMGVNIKGNFWRITFKESGHTPGLTAENIKGIGKIIKWTEKGSSCFTYILIYRWSDGRKYVGEHVDDKK